MCEFTEMEACKLTTNRTGKNTQPRVTQPEYLKALINQPGQ